MNQQPDKRLHTIMQTPGFQHIASAIRESTVRAQRRTSQENDNRYEVRYGLNQELLRKARSSNEFMTALGEFIALYNAETAREEEKLARRLNKRLTAEDYRTYRLRYPVTTADMEQFGDLLDCYPTELVATMLVAYGYSRVESLKKEEVEALDESVSDDLEARQDENEGSEGNQIQTRMIDIVGEDKALHNVNAISGDMLKHVLMEHYYRRAKEEQLSLCASCQRFNVNRINDDREFLATTRGIKDALFIDQMLQRCAMDDIGGILVTEVPGEKRSIPRKSICEFGWVAALPEVSRTESYFHVKYVPERGDSQRKEDANDQDSGANRGQNIFHRPANSGIYALVCHLELSRIGYNDITQEYAVSEEERKKRMTVLLESVMYTFLELNGAMRATQLPHLVALEGFISTSSRLLAQTGGRDIFGR